MSDLKFIAIIQAFNELPDNLPRCVASARRLCQEIVGYDDGSTDGSGAWMDAHMDHVFHGAKNDWHDEIAHKKLMLDEAKRRGADWILWIDCDEQLMRGTPDAVKKRIAENPELTGICLCEINLWGDEQHYRTDKGFGDAGFLRLWKNRPELQYGEVGPGLHRHQFPEAAREKIESLGYPSPGILHYSWSSHEKIVAKHARYEAQGQSGWNLSRLLPDPNAVLEPIDPDWLPPKE